MENLNGRKRVEEGELCDRRNGDQSYLVNSSLDAVLCQLPIFMFFSFFRKRS
jgi:hypothetical protein